MTVNNYLLDFHIDMEFTAELEDTTTDQYHWLNATVSELVRVRLLCVASTTTDLPAVSLV